MERVDRRAGLTPHLREDGNGTFDIDVVTQYAFPAYVKDRLVLAQAVADFVAEDPL